MAEIRRKVVKQGKRNAAYRFILARGNKDKIAAWKQDLVRVLHIFNVGSAISVVHSQTEQRPYFQTELVMDIHTMVADMHRNALTGQEGVSDQNHSVCATCYPQTTECSPPTRLEPGQQC